MPNLLTKVKMRPELGMLPVRMLSLPLDERGYPIPWFVARLPDGTPEFRAMDAAKWIAAVKQKRCWVCGMRLGAHLAFVAGPMCLINLTSSEPPSHLLCARWSAQNCPFLTRPRMVRRENDLPAEVEPPAGIGLTRNPGVCAVYVTGGYQIFRDAQGKPLIRMNPDGGRNRLAAPSVEWFSEGRAATRAEVRHSIEGGLPTLLGLAEAEGPEAVDELRARVRALERWLPVE